MPELPEVETMVRGIRPHVLGSEIADVVRSRCTRRPITIVPAFRTLRARCLGCRIASVERLAKRIVLRLSSGDVLAIEPRMTGLVLIADPPTRAHLRMEWRLRAAGGHRSLWFWDRRGLGTISLYRADEFDRQIVDRLGPDPLRMTLAGWRRLCGSTQRPIKVALLDQRLIAGIGNLYASEILHAARIHPATPSNSLTIGEIRRLRQAAVHILSEAIRYEGSTLSDGTYRNALNRQGSYQTAHQVYARAGARCPVCHRGVIERIVQAQRSTFYCPRCQRWPAPPLKAAAARGVDSCCSAPARR